MPNCIIDTIWLEEGNMLKSSQCLQKASASHNILSCPEVVGFVGRIPQETAAALFLLQKPWGGIFFNYSVCQSYLFISVSDYYWKLLCDHNKISFSPLELESWEEGK